MLRVTNHPAWTEWADELARLTNERERVGVRLPFLPERFVASVRAAAPGAVYVFVPSSPDQAERILLSLGASLGGEAPAQVDHHLRNQPDETDALLEHLARQLGDRPLLVDGWDNLGAVGVDHELGSALRDRTDAILRWFGRHPGLFVGRARVPNSIVERDTPGVAPVQLANGEVVDTSSMWTDFRGDASLYALSLAARALTIEPDDEPLSEGAIRARITELLPTSVARALELLALHARPLRRELMRGFGVDFDAINLGIGLGLWAEAGGELNVEAGWPEYYAGALSYVARVRVHANLANAFLSDVRPEDPSAPGAGVSILEAHRHLVSAGDFERAKDYWRYGASLLIEAARGKSIARQFGPAARLYGSIVAAADAKQIALPKRLNAYARHYLHFNRGHGELETFAATERGYRRALQDWPENALFWSRLVRVMCFQEKFGVAMTDLATARDRVAPHPQKETFLVARTVWGLLSKQRIVDAIRVWGNYRADTHYAIDIQQRLAQVMAAGWSVERLLLNPEAPLVFLRPLELRVVSGAGAWSAECRTLDVVGSGASPLEALGALVAAMRLEASELIRAYTSDLSASDRLRKRLLLGSIDIQASRIEASAPDGYWFFGTLQRDARALWLRTGGDRDLWFEVPPDLVDVVDDLPHLARVSNDDLGIPCGPVIELKPGFQGSDDELWEAWRRLQSDAG